MNTTRRSSGFWANDAPCEADVRQRLQAWPAGERGSAVLVVLALLSIMLVFLAANTRSTQALRREVKLVEKQQVERLRQAAAHRPPAGIPATRTRPAP